MTGTLPALRSVTPRRRLVLVGAAGLVAAGSVGLGLASRHKTPSLAAFIAAGEQERMAREAERAREQAESRARRRRLTKGIKGDPPGSPLLGRSPAEIIRDPESPVSTAVQWRVRNGWHTSGHRQFTAVYAGGSGADKAPRSMGRFVILRQNFVRLTQDVNVVDVPGAGPLKITDAPLGEGVRRWAQRRGEIRFTSKYGVRGRLHLKDDSVTLD